MSKTATSYKAKAREEELVFVEDNQDNMVYCLDDHKVTTLNHGTFMGYKVRSAHIKKSLTFLQMFGEMLEKVVPAKHFSLKTKGDEAGILDYIVQNKVLYFPSLGSVKTFCQDSYKSGLLSEQGFTCLLFMEEITKELMVAMYRNYKSLERGVLNPHVIPYDFLYKSKWSILPEHDNRVIVLT